MCGVRRFDLDILDSHLLCDWLQLCFSILDVSVASELLYFVEVCYYLLIVDLGSHTKFVEYAQGSPLVFDILRLLGGVNGW